MPSVQGTQDKETAPLSHKEGGAVGENVRLFG